MAEKAKELTCGWQTRVNRDGTTTRTNKILDAKKAKDAPRPSAASDEAETAKPAVDKKASKKLSGRK